MKLPEIAIQRPVFISVVFLVVTLLGGVSFFLLPVDLMPDLEFPTISVRTTYTGVAPREIEELITRPLERTLASTPGVEEITSSSSEGNSQIQVRFSWGTDLDAATNEVRSRIDQVRRLLPDDAEPPVVFKFDANSVPVMFLGISSGRDQRELRQFVEDQIQYRLERIPGVAQADVWGGLRRQIHVTLDRAKLDTLRVDPAQISAALRRGNINEPAGQIVEGSFDVLLRTEGQFASLEEIAATMVARRAGQPIYLRDVASVQDSHEEVRNLVRINGEAGLRMGIRKQPGANTVQVAESITEEIHRINRDFPQIRLSVLQDNAVFIQRSVANVRDATLYGSILAVVILLLFLRNFRSTLIIAIAIPISVITTFALMYFYGFTLNTITFGGLALGVGMLVDNAIVVLENIFRLRETGESRHEAARKGSTEVALAITASTLTTIVVFLPVIFMEGMAGLMFQQLAWVVSFSLFASLLVALTLIPLLSSRMIRVREPQPGSVAYGIVHRARLMLEGLDASYAQGIRWSLRHPKTVIAATLALVSATVLLVPFIGFELQPETDDGALRVSLELPAGAQLAAADDVTRRTEEIIRRSVPEMESMLTEVGSQGGWQGANTNTSSIRVTLVPRSQRTRSSQQAALELRRELSSFPGVLVRVRAGGGMPMMGRMQGGGDRLSVDIRGFDLGRSQEVALQVRRLMEETQGVSDAMIERAAGRPETVIRLDRVKAAAMGVGVTDVSTNIRTSIGGTTAGYFRQGGHEYDILVRYAEPDRRRLQDVLSMPVPVPSGQMVPLESLALIDRTEGPVSIDRKDQQRIVTVRGNLAGTRDLGSVMGELQERVRGLELPPDTAVVFGGEWEEQQEAFRALLLSFLLAVVLVYLVMAAQFESFRAPFLIMFSLPLAGIGVVLALFLTDTTFNIQAFIGLIMLAGIVVNNAIVLVDCVLQLQRHHDFGLQDALVTGGRRRLRPILMTTLTTVLGLVPMALGVGEGGELQAPMARVLIGGLTTSTLITLFLIPTLYLLMERARMGARRAAAEGIEPGMEPVRGD